MLSQSLRGFAFDLDSYLDGEFIAGRDQYVFFEDDLNVVRYIPRNGSILSRGRYPHLYINSLEDGRIRIAGRLVAEANEVTIPSIREKLRNSGRILAPAVYGSIEVEASAFGLILDNHPRIQCDDDEGCLIWNPYTSSYGIPSQGINSLSYTAPRRQTISDPIDFQFTVNRTDYEEEIAYLLDTGELADVFSMYITWNFSTKDYEKVPVTIMPRKIKSLWLTYYRDHCFLVCSEDLVENFIRELTVDAQGTRGVAGSFEINSEVFYKALSLYLKPKLTAKIYNIFTGQFVYIPRIKGPMRQKEPFSILIDNHPSKRVVTMTTYFDVNCIEGNINERLAWTRDAEERCQ